jgi:plasmid stabilization system protein ParE
MPNQRFEYHPDAIAEATEAYDWYAERNETVAERFWEELRRARQMVTKDATSWSSYLHGTRCFLFDHYPYGLVYVERGEKIIGIAVAHLKRRPGYWRNRLDD